VGRLKQGLEPDFSKGGTGVQAGKLERVGSLIPGKPIRVAARRRWPTVRGSWRRKVEGGGDVEGIPTLHGERTWRS